MMKTTIPTLTLPGLVGSAVLFFGLIHLAGAERQLRKQIEPPHTGHIRFDPEQRTYEPGARIDIEAIPRGRFSFKEWGGAVPATAENPLPGFEVKENATVIARFEAGYLADRPLLSPRRNVFYAEHPRDLWFQVHQNRHNLIGLERNGQPVAHERERLKVSADAEPLPDSLTIRIAAETIAGFGTGRHQLDFRFDGGRELAVEIDLIAEGEGRSHDMNIVSFYVDHGAAVLIDFPNGETLLIDTGTRDAAIQHVVPFLKQHLPVRANGRQRVDHIFITHWHYDHFHGLGPLLEAFEVGSVRYNLEFPPSHEGRYGNRENPDDPYGYGEYGFAPRHWDEFRIGNSITDIGGVEILVLNAGLFDEEDEALRYYRPEHYEGYYGRNNRSLSFRLKYGDFVYSHGGDVYQHAQQAILKTFESKVRSHIYHANHHFHGGVSREYLLAVEPYVFLTSANSAVYDRDAFSEVVLNQVIRELERTSDRFRENLLSVEVGHTVIRVDGTELWYETYYRNHSYAADYTVPYLFGRDR
jgi:hypothetical protein